MAPQLPQSLRHTISSIPSTADTNSSLIQRRSYPTPDAYDWATVFKQTQGPRPWDLSDAAVAQVRTWLQDAAQRPSDPSGEQLAGVLQDPNGMTFTIRFVDRVIRPEDNATAAKALHHVSKLVPRFLPWHLRTAVQTGGLLGSYAPSVIIPAARQALRSMVNHLILDARKNKLGPSIRTLRKQGVDLNLNLLGETVLGRDEADRRIQDTLALIQREDVDYVSIKGSATVAPTNHWAFEEAVHEIMRRMRPIYAAARDATPRTFVNLDMEEYKDLDLTLAVFQRLLAEKEFLNCEAGIVLQAYLPDACSAMVQLQRFAAQRVADGGAPIKVRVVKGANLPMEQVQARIMGWEQAVWPSKQSTDANYKAILDYALRPEHLRHVHLGIAGHNLFDIALAYQLMQARDIHPGHAVGFEMLLGMATQQAAAVQQDVGSIRLYTPIVHPDTFDVAIAYLVRRLEEGASQENFMSAVFELQQNTTLFQREEARFRASVQELRLRGNALPQKRRIQNRLTESYATPSPFTPFANEPDTDPDLIVNRQWAQAIIDNIPHSTLGEAIIQNAKIRTAQQLDHAFEQAVAAAQTWQAIPLQKRAEVLYRAADKIADKRAALLEVMGSETGKTLDQGDPEVSEAIDFCRYYAHQCLALSSLAGATHKPVNVTVVTPPWNFPVAIPCGSVVAALAAGSAVMLKPADLSRRCAAVMTACIWEALDEAHIDRHVLQLLWLDEDTFGEQLIADPRVDRLILTGAYDTAKLFRRFHPTLPLLAETSGKNAIIVTPSADIDLAVADIVQSAFGHAGQKCSAASFIVLVGAMGRSERFFRQLIDAAQSLTVGWPQDPRSQMGPIIEVPQDKLAQGLHTLEGDETWLLTPTPLDNSGRLFSPGIRDNVRPRSTYHLTEYFGPILGVMRADTLQEAVQIVNDVDYGLTSGLHSLDADDIAYWTDHIDAGNLYINRGITGAIVQRQPFGGWKRSSVGAGTKAGGPNYLIGLSHWCDASISCSLDTHDGSRAAILAHTLARHAAASDLGSTGLEHDYTLLTGDDANWLVCAIAQDAEDVAHFTGIRDVTGLEVEINAFRYRPVPVTVRLSKATTRGMAEAARVVAAGLRVHEAVTTGHGTAQACTITLSLPQDTPDRFVHILRGFSMEVTQEDDATWNQRVQQAARSGPHVVERLRIVGETQRKVAAATYYATQGEPDVAIYDEPVTSSGRIEMLPFVREQAISMTAHRFGTIHDLARKAGLV